MRRSTTDFEIPASRRWRIRTVPDSRFHQTHFNLELGYNSGTKHFKVLFSKSFKHREDAERIRALLVDDPWNKKLRK